MTKRPHIMFLAVLVLPFLLAGAMQAQARSCKEAFDFQAGQTSPVPPGSVCDTTGPFLAVCYNGADQCPICEECQKNTVITKDPINLANGDTFITQSDLTIAGLGGGLSLSRTGAGGPGF